MSTRLQLAQLDLGNANRAYAAGQLDLASQLVALIGGLDLVISVDTSVVHLAAAMGKSVWLLNRFAGCWRWLRDREDSPWYPGLRLFTQRERGDWDDVLERVRGEVQRLCRDVPMQAASA